MRARSARLQTILADRLNLTYRYQQIVFYSYRPPRAIELLQGPLICMSLFPASAISTQTVIAVLMSVRVREIPINLSRQERPPDLSISSRASMVNHSMNFSHPLLRHQFSLKPFAWYGLLCLPIRIVVHPGSLPYGTHSKAITGCRR